MSGVDRSLADGVHARLADLVGTFAGEARTWFEPGVLGDASPWRVVVRPLLGGRFVELAYEGSLGGEPLRGHGLLGFHLQRGVWELAWADTFHTGTQLMACQGVGKDGGIDVVGHYPAGEGPDWGWRTTLAPTDRGLRLAMHNVTPDGDEALAVELDAIRVSDGA